MDFSDFDARGYRTVDVRTGYGEWVTNYEQTVEDAMDIALLDRLQEPSWATVSRAADLGCGTGRTGQWLRDKGVPTIDGVDLTPEMLAVAERRGAHDRLVEADVAATGLPTGSYDLVISSLIDEHLDDLRPLYREAWRLAAPKAAFVLVAFHPHFIMTPACPPTTPAAPANRWRSPRTCTSSATTSRRRWPRAGGWWSCARASSTTTGWR
ncbi:hypothetical protein GCM10011581_17570 [Saccharopolyspora subtropica]|uniref:Methyltransferase type 11 domain-containing protein n=1 Tax=Saccharopolyspora thermophila TaxID=89367 RepID=A0A917JPY8_9PSEU|nr:class I SAM-dependent methyltransferase [Saccharopolyspora subtropica]GGI80742.1 hypothetical protein GCM10011581_17570 [Saccharopolyspora subtropica]